MQAQPGSQLRHHIMLKIGTIISNDGLRDTKPRNDVIEYELNCCLTISDKCRHFFDPFGEVVNGYDDISMPPGRVRVTHHKIDAPLRKGTNGNERMNMGRRRTHLALIDLAIMELTNNNDAVFKDGGPEIFSMKNLMRSSISRHVTITGATVTFIQGLFNLLESQTPVDNGINSDAVECISDYAIRLR